MTTFRQLGMLVLLAAAARPGLADITITDIQVAARALTFMENPLSGRVRVGIVYAAQSPRSLGQAEALQERLGAGLTVGNLELSPVLVPIESASTADVDFFLLTEFMPPGYGLAAISKARQIPCVTTDIGKVEEGACIVAVRSRPKVEIIVNLEAARDSGMRFATAFRVMVTEI